MHHITIDNDHTSDVLLSKRASLQHSDHHHKEFHQPAQRTLNGSEALNNSMLRLALSI